MSRGGDLDCKVYVGNLPRDLTERELEIEFEKFGALEKVWVARNPPGFAFVEFKDPRDADDAINELDGKHKFGDRIRVEPSSGKRRVKPWERDGGRDSRDSRDSRGPPRYDSYRGPSRGRAFDPRDKCYKCGEEGHYAYDCKSGGGGSGGRGGGRSR